METVKELLERYGRVKTHKYELLPTALEAERLAVFCRQFDEVCQYVAKSLLSVHPHKAYETCKKVFGYDSHLTKCAVYSVHKTNQKNIGFDCPVFQTFGPLSQPMKTCKTGYQYVPSDRTKMIVPGFSTMGRKSEGIKTDAKSEIELYHLVTVFQEDGRWFALTDVKPAKVNDHPAYDNKELAKQVWHDKTIWTNRFDNKPLSRDDFLRLYKAFPCFFYQITLVDQNGQEYRYFGAVTTQPKKMSKTLNYQGSGSLLYLCRKVCGLKVVKKTVLNWFESEEKAKCFERDFLSGLSQTDFADQVLNCPTGCHSADLFSLAQFINRS